MLFLLGSFSWSCSDKSAEAERPNIVLIMADDMGFSDIGYFGSNIRTPNIDQLAKDGLVMSRFYNSGRCVPTRASLLTGLYQHQTGLGDMTSDLGYETYQGFLNNKNITIAEALQKGGYTTMMTGKWHLGEPKQSWPQNRGFEHFYGVPKGGGIYFYPFLINREVMFNDQVVEADSSFYSTDAFNDYGAQFIEEHEDKDNPFFLYVAHIAPHFPLQAPKEDIARYRGKYREGFQKYRKKRFQRQKELGILPKDTQLSPSDERVERWITLSEAQKDTLDKKMATYAAQVDRMDQGIGRIIQKLKETGEFENTVILFLSDNGGVHKDLDQWNIEGDDGPIGSRNSWESYSASWGNVSNTPFRLYKHWVHEGGISTPIIMHWPNVIKEHRKSRQVGHVIDVMPTLLDLAGVEYPNQYNGNNILPPEGVSLAPLIRGKDMEEDRTLFWEHEGNRAVRDGKWKLVSKYPENTWRLYNMNSDRTELHNLSSKRPALVDSLKQKYQAWAQRVGVIPWSKVKGH
jgi:arylsulfatase